MAERENLKFSHENGVHLLKITKPKVTDIGSYTCSGSQKGSQDLRVASKSSCLIRLLRKYLNQSLCNFLNSGANCRRTGHLLQCR